MRKIHPPAIWVPPWLGNPRASAGFTEASRPSLVDPGAMACSAVPSEMAPLLGATWKRPATPPSTAATWRAEVMLGPWGARSGLGKTGGPIHDLLVVEPCWTWNMWFPWQKCSKPPGSLYIQYTRILRKFDDFVGGNGMMNLIVNAKKWERLG